jgi:hypothetical protein
MVARACAYVVATLTGLLGEATDSRFMQLPPAARARFLGALFLLAIGGIALVTLTWLALRVGRRNLRRLDKSAPPRWSEVAADDWAQKPLAPKPPAQVNLDDE